VNRADAGELAERQDMSECGVVAEIEPEPRRVDEDELSRDSELELTLFGAQLLGERAYPVGESLHVVEQHDFGHLYTPIIGRRCSNDPQL
jgi:hypothetical protein